MLESGQLRHEQSVGSKAGKEGRMGEKIRKVAGER
jgi:hypothetical protein